MFPSPVCVGLKEIVFVSEHSVSSSTTWPPKHLQSSSLLISHIPKETRINSLDISGGSGGIRPKISDWCCVLTSCSHLCPPYTHTHTHTHVARQPSAAAYPVGSINYRSVDPRPVSVCRIYPAFGAPFTSPALAPASPRCLFACW